MLSIFYDLAQKYKIPLWVFVLILPLYGGLWYVNEKLDIVLKFIAKQEQINENFNDRMSDNSKDIDQLQDRMFK